MRFVKIRAGRAVLSFWPKSFSIHTIHISWPIWVKFSISDLHITAVEFVWISWKSAHGRPYFWYGRKSNCIYLWTVKPYDFFKVKNALVMCAALPCLITRPNTSFTKHTCRVLDMTHAQKQTNNKDIPILRSFRTLLVQHARLDVNEACVHFVSPTFWLSEAWNYL